MKRTGMFHGTGKKTAASRRACAVLLVSVFLAVTLTAGSVFAETLSFSIDTPKRNVITTNTGTVTSVVVHQPGYSQTSDAGKPSLPFRVISVLLPQGQEVASARFQPSGDSVIRKGLNVEKAQSAISTDGLPTTGSDGLAAADEVFPPVYGRYLSTGYLHGRAIATFAVYPLRMRGADLYVAETIELAITTMPSSEFIVNGERRRESDTRRIEGLIAGLVINPEAIGGYAFPTVDVAKTSGGFQPTSYPSLEGSPVEYVIITSADLADEYQVLADWKTAKGVPTVVRTIEWIVNNTRQGADLAETIRFFIRDAYVKWGIRYVLLGGDTDILPTRYALSRYHPPGGETYVPTDLYYGCLDGTWNGDGDSDWGEPEEDNPDFYAEVYYGRMPLSDPVEVATIIDRIKRYERAENPSYMDKYLLMAEVLFPYGWDLGDPEPITLNGPYFSETNRLYIDTTRVRLTRMYETYDLYPGSVPETRDAALDSLSSGFNHVFHVGHGFRQNASCGDRSIENAHADTLTNDGRWFNLYMLNCTAAAYDYICLAERFLANPMGGAVSVIGAAESAFPQASSYYMHWYNYYVFRQEVVHIGEAFARSRLARTAYAVGNDGGDAWTHFVYAILAEPEMQMFTANPDTLVVSHVTNVGLGLNSISLLVTAGGVPVDTAMICLSKDDDDYQTALTDVAGQATIGFVAESPGSISVVVTAVNAIPYEGSITVNPSAAAYVSIASVTIDDDGIGGSAGNGDGLVDAGETVDFILELSNEGGTVANDVSISLSSGNGAAAVVDGVAQYGAIDPNTTKSTTDVIRVAFDPGITDGSVLEFSVVVSEQGSPQWSDGFKKIVHAPLLELTGLRIDDTALGDGDGIVGAGENFELFYGIKNYGTGAVFGVSAVIEDLDGSFTLISNTAVYPYLSALEAAENLTGFEMMESDTTTEHSLLITLTDAYNRTQVDTFELRPPSPPTTIELDPSLGSDRLSLRWDTSVSPDVARYNVYWAPNMLGPFSLVNGDPVDHASYLSTGLAPLTENFFYVRAMDESGNLSPPSPTYSAFTNPPQLSGFPAQVGFTSFCSPAVGDVDGDGDNEVVVGADYIYAWHADGTEVVDGDMDPATSGVLNAVGYHFDGGITLGPVDNVPGLEIIANDIGTESVYVVNRDGAILPGWPRPGEDVFRATPVLGDIDGDVADEVIAIDASGVIFAWNADGSEVIDGDADPLTQGVLYRTPPTTFHYHTPSVCDLDGDGKEEIVVGTRSGNVYALNGDGSNVLGWPFVLPGEMAGAVVTGDIDNDSFLEVVVRSSTGEVFLLNHDGTVVPGWPLVIPYTDAYFRPSPALADLDDDGTLEIVLPYYSNTTHEGRMYVVDHMGNTRPGWPQKHSDIFTWASPVVSDLDGDGQLDIVACGDEGYIWGWDRDGNVLNGFPMRTRDAIRGTPFFCDFDGDNDEDLVVHSWDQNVYAYDFAGLHAATAGSWPTFQANVKRNGSSGSVVASAIGGAEFDFLVNGSNVTLTLKLPLTNQGTFDVLRDRADENGAGAGEFTLLVAGVPAGDDGVLHFTDRTAVMGTRFIYKLVSTTDPKDTFTTQAIYIPVSHAGLDQNYPNPFNPSTAIVYYVPEGSTQAVSLVVYDVSGAHVRTLVEGLKRPGRYVVSWDGRSDAGTAVASGIYFYRLVEGRFTATKKMMLVK